MNEKICMICNKIIEEEQPVEMCPDCDKVYHKSCWKVTGNMCVEEDCRKKAIERKETEEQQRKQKILEARTPIEEIPEQISKPQTDVCPSCGARLSEDSLFCGNCGIKLIINKQPQSPEQQDNIQKQKPFYLRPWLWITSGIIIILIVVITIIAVFANKPVEIIDNYGFSADCAAIVKAFEKEASDYTDSKIEVKKEEEGKYRIYANGYDSYSMIQFSYENFLDKQEDCPDDQIPDYIRIVADTKSDLKGLNKSLSEVLIKMTNPVLRYSKRNDEQKYCENLYLSMYKEWNDEYDDGKSILAMGEAEESYMKYTLAVLDKIYFVASPETE